VLIPHPFALRWFHAAVSPRAPAARALARSFGASGAAALALLAAGPATSASAAPPPNDSPAAAERFQPYTAENGRPTELQAVAELVEARPDAGVPRCLGATSFARTVWYVIPAEPTAHEISVEATGETSDVLDVAAFVQPPDSSAALTSQPNACSGVGAGGGAAAAEPSSGIGLRVPAGRSVIVQVGRRGPLGSADAERAVVSLDDREIESPAAPPDGDIASPATPLAGTSRNNVLPLFGATLTDEDPAQPPCPSLGSVWRKVVPATAGPRLISARGTEAATLSVFAGSVPASGLDCVNRSGRGALQLLVQGRRGQPLWIRVGTDRPAQGAVATLRVDSGAGAFVVDGGPGGFDPTPFGPGGGLPTDCDKADAQRASVAGAPFGGTVKQLGRRRTVTVPFVLRRGPVCDVLARLIGPRGRVYATARTLRIKSGPRRIRLDRTGYKLAKGSYRLQIRARSRFGEPVYVRSSVKGKLR
jgi:hypothetical protein